MSKKSVKLEPIFIESSNEKIHILFEGLKPIEIYCPNIPKEKQESDEKYIAFMQIKLLVDNRDWDSLFETLRPNNDLKKVLKDDFGDHKDLVIKNGRIYYKGFRVTNSLSYEIIESLSEFNRSKDKSKLSKIKKNVNLLVNMLKSPYSETLSKLHDFVRNNNVIVNDKGEMISLYVTVDADSKHGTHKLKKGEEHKVPVVFSHDHPIVVKASPSKPLEGGKVFRVTVNPKDVVIVSSRTLTVSSLKISSQKVVDPDWED